MPSPVILWSLALAVALVGLKRRHPRRVTPAPTIPTLIRIGARVPTSAAAVRFLERHQRGAEIAAAGLDTVMSPSTLARSRAGLATFGLVMGGALALAAPIAGLVALPITGMGLVAPMFLMARRARHRREAIIRDLPDLMDMVVLCTESGAPLEASLRVSVRRFSGALADEIRGTLARLDLGVPRRSAFRTLAERMEVQELTTLVSAILQAEELGTPISDVLSRQAETLRANRRQAVRDHAARAAPKVQLVVAMVMVPGALLLVVGVMILKLIGEMGVVVGGAP